MRKSCFASIGLATIWLMLCCAACQSPGDARKSVVPDDAETLRFADADASHAPAPVQAGSHPTKQRHFTYELSILHVLIPSEDAHQAEKIWNYIREDALDSDTQIRLRENGVRAGIGNARFWPPIKAVLDAIEGNNVAFATPVRLPAGYPLLLEMIVDIKEQTLFYVGRDGILTGATWPESRNVLRVAYVPDTQNADRIVLFAVPEVHCKSAGWEWIRAEAGLRADPKHVMETFDVAGVVAPLDPGEFLVLAPNENAKIAGLLGEAFFTKTSQGRRYHSFIFLRPEAQNVGQHD